MEKSFKGLLRSGLESLCNKIEKKILSNRDLSCKMIFGPVRSRRLGLIIGINNISSKACSYNCVYCPNKNKSCCSICTGNCLSPYELFVAVKKKLSEIELSQNKINYIVFAGSGDPTMDTELPKEIMLMREFGYKIAVFTNASMLWNENIQQNLMFADYVSLKIDSVYEDTWEKINRPHERLSLEHILNGIRQFSKIFRGTLVTETNLIKNINDNEIEINGISDFVNSIKIDTAYFTTPIYPPAETYAGSPDKETILYLSDIIRKRIINSVLLCCPEKHEFYSTGDFENELIGLLEIHPVNKEAVTTFARENGKIDNLQGLILNKIIDEIVFGEKKYYKLT